MTILPTFTTITEKFHLVALVPDAGEKVKANFVSKKV